MPSRSPQPHTGTAFDIQSYALYDGPGIRSALFLKGCPLRCYWCHNPEAHCRKPEVFHWPDRSEVVGERLTLEDALERLLADRAFFDQSGGGVTLTGGEPTSQPDFLFALLELLHKQGVHTTLETCGFFPPPMIGKLIELVDLFLFDIKHADDDAHRRGTGQGNQRILDNFKAILSQIGPAQITPRIPLIPGFNADSDSLQSIADFLSEAGYRGEVHVMPYHGWAKSKYQALGRNADYPQTEEPSAEQKDSACQQLRARDLEPVLYG